MDPRVTAVLRLAAPGGGCHDTVDAAQNQLHSISRQRTSVLLVIPLSYSFFSSCASHPLTTTLALSSLSLLLLLLFLQRRAGKAAAAEAGGLVGVLRPVSLLQYRQDVVFSSDLCQGLSIWEVCVCVYVCACQSRDLESRQRGLPHLGSIYHHCQSYTGWMLAVDVSMLTFSSSCTRLCMHTEGCIFSATLCFSSTPQLWCLLRRWLGLVCLHTCVFANECVECLTKVTPLVTLCACIVSQPDDSHPPPPSFLFSLHHQPFHPLLPASHLLPRHFHVPLHLLFPLGPFPLS